MTTLDSVQIASALETLHGWKHEDACIQKTFTLPTFHRAIGFVTEIGILAEVADHHPDIDIRYNNVTVLLSTHSAGGVTDQDIALAGRIEKAAGA
jgi:4a-hydroxytetrahydrobiopterin dehydratase